MSQQVAAKYPSIAWMGGWMRACEEHAIRNAEAVVPVCDALAEIAGQYQPRRVAILRDISLLAVDRQSSPGARSLKDELRIDGPTVMYIGNLEPYQGIDLLLESFALAKREVPSAQLVIVGGSAAGVRQYRERSDLLRLNGSVHFVGPQPVDLLTRCFASADVLVSPRITGGNTPMKIYSYLDSGCPVLATDLPTHTQVLTDQVAILRPAATPALCRRSCAAAQGSFAALAARAIGQTAGPDLPHLRRLPEHAERALRRCREFARRHRCRRASVMKRTRPAFWLLRMPPLVSTAWLPRCSTTGQLFVAQCRTQRYH